MEKAAEATKDVPMAEAVKDNSNQDEEEDVELTGMDLEGIDDEEEEENASNDDVEMNDTDDNRKSPENEEALSTLQAADAEEMEAAKRERMELLAAEQKQAAAEQEQEADIDPKKKFEHLLAKSDVFAHFLAGSVAAQRKKGKKGSRGKKGRLTEAEEDAQLLKTSQSKRSTVRLEKQPNNISHNVSMHKYQLEGLNWLIKLHDSGINGILADGK